MGRGRWLLVLLGSLGIVAVAVHCADNKGIEASPRFSYEDRDEANPQTSQPVRSRNTTSQTSGRDSHTTNTVSPTVNNGLDPRTVEGIMVKCLGVYMVASKGYNAFMGLLKYGWRCRRTRKRRRRFVESRGFGGHNHDG